ncbi:hypothetical protein [Kineosporia succinea]|uniref:DUF4440 domain-containing protein n=1 Tax=Kineosporia succinea TaxID=84632 RepID=A0ABT9PER5_9ACTN|nr:hypothetical protein [Kineosporia succinea]MDP9831202.1 hypothetical protein [Kineosporia succinea]
MGQSMDRAWQIEQEFWQDSAGPGPAHWFARYMAADGFIVLPNRVVSRDGLVHGWSDRGPLRTWELGQPSFTVIEGGNLVMNYEAHLEADWLPGYDAYITSVYVWGAGDWSMICRTHTPRGAFPF